MLETVISFDKEQNLGVLPFFRLLVIWCLCEHFAIGVIFFTFGVKLWYSLHILAFSAAKLCLIFRERNTILFGKL